MKFPTFLFFTFVFVSLILSPVSAVNIGDNGESPAGVEIINPVARPIQNFSQFSTNSSDFWDNLDTPADITDFVRIAGDNMTGSLGVGTGGLTIEDNAIVLPVDDFSKYQILLHSTGVNPSRSYGIGIESGGMWFNTDDMFKFIRDGSMIDMTLVGGLVGIGTETPTSKLQVAGNVSIDSDDDVIALQIDTEATTADGVIILADALTTGDAMIVESNADNTGVRTVLRVIQERSTASGATNAVFRQDGNNINLQILSNGNGRSLFIDSTGTSSDIIDIATPATTTGTILRVDDANSLTTGTIAHLESNSPDVSTRTLIKMSNQHASADATTVLSLDQDGDNNALFIDAETTIDNIVEFSVPTLTSGTGISGISFNSLTTGKFMSFESSSADTSTRELVTFHNNQVLSTGARVLELIQDSTNSALLIDLNDNGVGISVPNPQTTTNDIVDISSADSLTTGKILDLKSNSANTSARQLVLLVNDNSLATGATPLWIQQDATQVALNIDANGNAPAIKIDTEATTTTSGGGLQILADVLTTGSATRISSNSADTSTRSLVIIHNDNTLATGTTVLELINDAGGDALTLRGNLDMNNFNITNVSTLFVSNITGNSPLVFFDANNSEAIAIFNGDRGGFLFQNREFKFEDDINGSSRLSLQNFNTETNATSSLSAINDVNGSMSIGITSSNYMFGDISLPNITALFSNARGAMVFANAFKEDFIWFHNPTDNGDLNDEVELMRLNQTGLVVAGNVTSESTFIPQYIFAHTNESHVLTGVGEWTNLTFSEEQDLKFGITHTADDATNATFTVTKSGIYEFNSNLDIIDTSVSASDIDVASRAILSNGTEIAGSVFETDIIKQDIEVELTHTFLARLNEGDKVLFQFTAEDVDVIVSDHSTFGDNPDSITVVIKKIANIGESN